MTLESKISNLLVICVAVTPLILIPNAVDYFYLPKIYFVYLLIAVMAIILILNRSEKKFIFQKKDWIIVLYMSILGISTLNSVDFNLSVWGRPMREEGVIALTAYLLLFYMTKHYYVFKPKHLKWIQLSAVIVSIYAISQYFGFDPIPRDYLRLTWRSRSFSTMGNPNFLGSYLVLILPLAIYQYLRSGKGIFLLNSGILYLALLTTFTRSCWLGEIFSILVVIVMARKVFPKDKRWYSKMGAILLLFILISVGMDLQSDGQVFSRLLSITSDAGQLITSEDNDNVGSHRIFIWKHVIPLIAEKPLLGYGPETLGLVFGGRYETDILEYFGKPYIVDKAHNEYLHMAYATGIPSLIVYLLLVILSLKNAYIKSRVEVYKMPVIASVLGYLVQAFFNISVVSVAYIYWIFLGVLASQNPIVQGEKSEVCKS